MAQIEYLDCQCRMEVMRIESIKDEKLKDFSTDLVQIAIYRQRPSASLKDRLKMIWGIITTGTPYIDDIILDDNDTARLINILESMRA